MEILCSFIYILQIENLVQLKLVYFDVIDLNLILKNEIVIILYLRIGVNLSLFSIIRVIDKMS